MRHTVPPKVPTRAEISAIVRANCPHLFRHPEKLGTSGVIPAVLILEDDAGLDSMDKLELQMTVEEALQVECARDFDGLRMEGFYLTFGARV